MSSDTRSEYVKSVINKDTSSGTTSGNRFYSCLKVDGIQSITESSLLSDERHILFYSQTKGEKRQLSIVDHSTLKCQMFTSGELSKAGWPESGWDKLAAWHSGSVLLYNGDPLKEMEKAKQKAEDKKRAQKDNSSDSDSDIDSDVSEDFRSFDLTVLKSFDINLEGSSLSKGSDIEIPNDLRCFEITAMSMDQNYTYIAFDSNPWRILVFTRNDNSLVARLVVPAPAAPGEYDLNQISDIVIRKDCIAATTQLGHIAIWGRELLVGAKNNVDIDPGWMSTEVDSLELSLETVIEQILMSQDCERMVVLDPQWCDYPAYISRKPEGVKKIPAREHGKRGESFLRVDEECGIAAVGVLPTGKTRGAATTPKLKIFDANEDNLLMTLPQLGPTFKKAVGDFLDFSIDQSSIKYYATKGIISVSVDFGKGKPMPGDIYTCSRNIQLDTYCWGSMRSVMRYEAEREEREEREKREEIQMREEREEREETEERDRQHGKRVGGTDTTNVYSCVPRRILPQDKLSVH
ncbi:hypothetical protein V491_08179 [Pseudogymnoascus sp. VKM F-3775]|nr:hypothetical protein V491_08179 [Pseudogymnoascus sp. VKM F-3775]